MLKNFLEILNEAPFVFHTLNSDGEIQNVSQGWIDLLGYSREEVIGIKFVELLTPDSRSYAEAVVLPDFWKTGKCRNIHYKIRTKNGNVLNILLNGIIGKIGEDGDTACSIASLVDITDRIRVESEFRQYRDDLELLVLERTEQLQETKEMYRTLSKASPVAMFRIDKNGQCEYVNDQWTKWTSMSQKDALGDGWLEAIHADNKDEFLKLWNNCFKNGLQFKQEIKLRCKDEKFIWVLGQAVPLQNGHGFVGTMTNVTKEKEMLPRLIELKQHTARGKM